MGSWLVDELVKAGHEVTSVDNLLGGKMRNVNRGSTFVRADLRIRSQVAPLVKGVDTIFHLAAYAAEGQSLFSPISINEINIVPMNNLLVEAVNNGVKRFVLTSSMAVYGDQKPPFREEFSMKPNDPYGAAKAYCENVLEVFAHNYDLEYVTIRPHNVYGPRQNIADAYRNVLGIWLNRILRGKAPIIYGDGEQTRAFSFIEDVTPALAKTCTSSQVQGQIINLGSDEVTSLNDACDLVLDVTGTKLKPEHHEERPGEVKHAYCSVDKATRLLGYRTKHRLRDGLVKMFNWAKQLGPQEPTYTLPLEITKRAPRAWVEKLM
jgi:UDP-glucose 4-epimerase